MEKVTDISKIMSLKKETEDKILAALNEFQDQTDLCISTIEVNTMDMPSYAGNDIMVASVNAKVVF